MPSFSIYGPIVIKFIEIRGCGWLLTIWGSDRGVLLRTDQALYKPPVRLMAGNGQPSHCCLVVSGEFSKKTDHGSWIGA